MRSYELLAASAPSFPSEPVGSAFSQRFAVHYATGLVSDLSGVRVTVAYWAVWGTCLALILLLMHVLLSRLRLSLFAYGLCAALVILNAFALRPYAIVPGMVQDLVFILGLAAGGAVVRPRGGPSRTALSSRHRRRPRVKPPFSWPRRRGSGFRCRPRGGDAQPGRACLHTAFSL
ncbi:MAG: hypothetical protein M3O70_03765 [Actinomycetota bacterium]|nr:hypothetical protein [Actinomycetota bacterium]